MGIIACAADDYSISYVLANLRHHCLRELTLSRVGSPDEAVREVYDQVEALRAYAIIRTALFGTDGYRDPIAIAIAYRVSPVIALFQTFSTCHWELIAVPFIRWFHREAAPVLVQNGIRMAETHILAEGPANYRWWQLLGMYRSGSPEPRGINGELYQRMIWEAKNVRHRQSVLANVYGAGNRRSGSGANPATSGRAKTAGGPGGTVGRVNGCGYEGDGGADQGDRNRPARRLTSVR